VGTLTLSSTGKIYSTTFSGATVPTGFAEQKSGGGTLTYSGKYTWACSSGDLAYIARTTALPATLIYVYRIMVHANTVSQNAVVMTAYDSVNSPTGAQLTSGNDTNLPMLVGYAASSGSVIGFYANAAEGGTRDSSWNADVDRILEVVSDGTNVTLSSRNPTTGAISILTDTKAWGSAQLPVVGGSLWVTIGNTWNIGWGGDHDCAYYQEYTTNNITVTGLTAGYHVDITDTADTVLAHGTAAGASLSIDASTCIFPLNGKVKVYSSDGGTLMATFTGSDIWGGDSYAYAISTVTVTAVTPSTGPNNASLDITNLEGTGFETGAQAKLAKTGQSDINATAEVVESANKITCTVDLDGAAVGAWDVVVTNPDTGAGTGTGLLTVTSTPTITSITPDSGINNASVAVTNLAGTEFAAGATVILTRTGQSNINATGVTVVSAIKITCTLPITDAAPGAWNVVVTNTDGGTYTLTDGFTVVAAPTNTDIMGISLSTPVMCAAGSTCTCSITGISNAGYINVAGFTFKSSSVQERDGNARVIEHILPLDDFCLASSGATPSITLDGVAGGKHIITDILTAVDADDSVVSVMQDDGTTSTIMLSYTVDKG
jgi:hypothetical protein